jgi:small subunit ribosomal protein S16
MAVKMGLEAWLKEETLLFHRVQMEEAPGWKIHSKLGTYNPLTVPATIQVDRQKALDWLQGAQPTDTVRRILSFKSIVPEALLRGVSLGLFDEKVQ